MIKSKIFYTDVFRTIETKLSSFINSQTDFLSPRTATSTRAVGDAIQDLLAEHFEVIAGDHIRDYSSAFARRAMADLAFSDADGLYYVVDVKTHRLDTKFNMPNLTSVERLARFYQDDRNYFVVLVISYDLKDTRITVKKVVFVPIEFLSWNCLTIGALGWGQIQIANSNKITVIPRNSRKRWMIELCNTLMEFYPSEIGKIRERVEHFKKVKDYWEKKKE